MIQVLAIYRPPFYKCWKIGRDITRITTDLGLRPLYAPDSRYERAPWHDNKLHAHVRKRTLRSPEGSQWHQDGDFGHIPMDHALVLWSDKYPTEFKINNVIYKPKPFEIILFKNLDGYHRRPLNAPRNRYLFRQRIDVNSL